VRLEQIWQLLDLHTAAAAAAADYGMRCSSSSTIMVLVLGQQLLQALLLPLQDKVLLLVLVCQRCGGVEQAWHLAAAAAAAEHTWDKALSLQTIRQKDKAAVQSQQHHMTRTHEGMPCRCMYQKSCCCRTSFHYMLGTWELAAGNNKTYHAHATGVSATAN
jgi:hypothetical protein